MRIAISLLMCVLPLTTIASDLSGTETKKIDYLLKSVTALNAELIRDSSVLDAAGAEPLMRRDLKLSEARVHTAEDFIRLCTVSQVTGVPHRLRFKDGRTVELASFLREALSRYPGSPVKRSTRSQ